MAIPPPLPAQDEGIAGILTTYSLVHLWASSRAALVASLRRRRARALAFREALVSGRHPTRRELAAWSFDGSAIQLAFPGLVIHPDRTVPDPAAAIARLDQYGTAIDEALKTLAGSAPDHARARALADLRVLAIRTRGSSRSVNTRRRSAPTPERCRLQDASPR